MATSARIPQFHAIACEDQTNTSLINKNLTKTYCPINPHPLGQTLSLTHQTRHTTTASKNVSPQSARLHGMLHRPGRHQVRQQRLPELR